MNIDNHLTETYKYTITEDPSFMTEPWGITPQVKKLLQDYYPKIEKGSPAIIKKLQELCSKYPDVPHFKNYLSTAYKVAGKSHKAHEVTKQLSEEHPEYLLGRSNLAIDYIEDDRPEKVPELLGEYLDLKELYPEREKFYPDELLAFHAAAVQYYLAMDDKRQAANHLGVMEELDYDHPRTERAQNAFMLYELEMAGKKFMNHKEVLRTVEDSGYDQAVQTDEKPSFNHPEINTLYQNSLRIDHEILKNLLSLPGESLIEDLETVLQDSIQRFEYFLDKADEEDGWNPEKHEFVKHALFLLAELEAVEALPMVLNLLRQGQELLDFWLSDFLTEDYWEIIYHFGQHKLPKLMTFMKEPANDVFARHTVPAAMEQIALHHPERRGEIIKWYRETFAFFLKNQGKDRIIDAELIGFMVSDCIDIEAVELTDIIELLFKCNLVDRSITGSLVSVKEDLPKRRRYSSKRKIFDDIYERYDDALQNWYYYYKDDEKQQYYQNDELQLPKIPEDDTPLDDEMEYKDDFSQTVVRKEKKVGRNDPCPCGSGRKYKKCCMR
jgi:uncharacterized protein YecA (UPF0149 family)